MSKRVMLVMMFVTVVSSLALITSILIKSAVAENRILVNDMGDESKRAKMKASLEEQNKKRMSMRRPKECVCSQQIDALTSRIITIDNDVLYAIDDLRDSRHYLINCQCGETQCVISEDKDTFCLK